MIKEWKFNHTSHSKISEEFYLFNNKNNMTVDLFLYYILRSKSVKNPDYYYKYVNSEVNGK